jgi:hypothetical protein
MIRQVITAVALAILSKVAYSAELERLFFSQQERESLDRQRRGEKVSPGTTSAPVVSGYIRRSDGKNTVWVDGQALRATDKQAQQSTAEIGAGATTGVQIKRSPEPGMEGKGERDARTKPKPASKKQPPVKPPERAARQPAG